MTKPEKINYLQEHHWNDWVKARSEADNEVSASCPMICVCGKLCTGFHENICRKFRDKVDSVTVSKLSHLIK